MVGLDRGSGGLRGVVGEGGRSGLVIRLGTVWVVEEVWFW